MCNGIFGQSTKQSVKAIALAALSVIGVGSWAGTGRAVEIDFDRYAVVAYSPATGQYGYAWNYASRSQAEVRALSRCRASDARIVGWVRGGWLVLAIGDNNAYGVPFRG